MKISKIGLAWIAVHDIERATHFLSDVVGLTVLNMLKEQGWAELVALRGDIVLGVGQVSDHQEVDPEHGSPIKPGQNAIITLTVDNIVSAKAELEQKGVSFVGDIIEVPGHVKLVTFTDPDGNFFQLVEEAAGA